MNAAASPAPRYVGCSTTRLSSTSCRFIVRIDVRSHRPDRPKYRFRGPSDSGGDTNTHTPTGSVPCHSSVTNRVSPTWWLR